MPRYLVMPALVVYLQLWLEYFPSSVCNTIEMGSLAGEWSPQWYIFETVLVVIKAVQ